MTIENSSFAPDAFVGPYYSDTPHGPVLLSEDNLAYSSITTITTYPSPGASNMEMVFQADPSIDPTQYWQFLCLADRRNWMPPTQASSLYHHRSMLCSSIERNHSQSHQNHCRRHQHCSCNLRSQLPEVQRAQVVRSGVLKQKPLLFSSFCTVSDASVFHVCDFRTWSCGDWA